MLHGPTLPGPMPSTSPYRRRLMARLLMLVPLLALAACADVVQPTAADGSAREALGAPAAAGYIVVLNTPADATPAVARARAEQVAGDVRVRPSRVFSAV